MAARSSRSGGREVPWQPRATARRRVQPGRPRALVEPAWRSPRTCRRRPCAHGAACTPPASASPRCRRWPGSRSRSPPTVAGTSWPAGSRRRAPVRSASARSGPCAQPDPEAIAGAVRECVAEPVHEVIVSSAFGLRAWLDAARRIGHLDALIERFGQARLLARDARTADGLRELGLTQIWSTAAATTEDLFRYLIAQPMTGPPGGGTDRESMPIESCAHALRAAGASRGGGAHDPGRRADPHRRAAPSRRPGGAPAGRRGRARRRGGDAEPARPGDPRTAYSTRCSTRSSRTWPRSVSAR